MAEVDSLFVKIEVDASDVVASVGKAKQAVSDFGNSVESSANKATKSVQDMEIKFLGSDGKWHDYGADAEAAFDTVGDAADKAGTKVDNFNGRARDSKGRFLPKVKEEYDEVGGAADEAADKAKKFGDETEKAGNGGTSALSKLIPSWQEVAFVITGALTAMAGAGVTMVQLAADADATVSKFNVVFGDGAAAATQWADSISQATGRNKYDIMETTASLQALMVGMGTNRDEAAKMSEAYTQLGLDMAAFYNTTDDEAITAIRSGISGETEPLKRFGVVLSETAVQEELVAMKGGDMAAALAAAGDDPEKLEMVRKSFEGIAKDATNAEKMQARYNIIMKATKDLQGQQSREAGGYQEQLKRLFATLKQGATDAGMSAMGSITGVVTKVNELLSNGGLTALKDIFKGIADGVAWVAVRVLDVAAAFTRWGNNGAFAVLKEFAGSILKNLRDELGGSLNAVREFAGSGGLGRLAEAAKITLQGMVQFSNFLRDVGAYKAIGNAIEGTIRVILGLVDIIARVIIAFRDFYTAAKNAYAQVTSGTAGMRAAVGAAFEAIRNIITTVINAIRNIVTNGWNSIRSSTTGSIDGIRNAVSTAWNAIRVVITTVINVIRSIVTTGWAGIRSVVIGAGTAIQSAITGSWNNIRNAVTSAMNTIRNTITAAWNGVRSNISSSMSAVAGAISSGFSSARNAVSSGVNSIVSSLRNAASSFYSAGSSWISSLLSGLNSKLASLRSAYNTIMSYVRGGSSASSGSSSSSSPFGTRTGSSGTGSATIRESFSTFYNTPSRIEVHDTGGLAGYDGLHYMRKGEIAIPKQYDWGKHVIAPIVNSLSGNTTKTAQNTKVTVTINNKAADVSTTAKTIAKVTKASVKAVSV